MRRGILLFPVMALGLLASIVALLALAIGPAQGAVSLPDWATHSQVVSGLTNPMDMEFAPDGRLFVAEQGGTIIIVQPNGTLAPSPFLDISAKVDTTGERGLQSLTFDPNFSTNHYVYLNYTKEATTTTPVHNRIVRVTANGDVAVAGSEKLIFRLNKQNRTHHMGGAIDFGNDGKLYISTGDNKISDNAQKLSNLFGKMLRINKDGTIPSSNPFYTKVSNKNRAIWALGLRNPFKFAVKPGATALFINDAGEHAWEEIDRGKSGANYGWNFCEGAHDNPDRVGRVGCKGSPSSPYTAPVHEYGHGSTETTGCAITGGAFYNPATVQFPDYHVGDYFFADLCNGWIRRYDVATDEAHHFATGLSNIVDLEVSENGELYYLSRGDSVSGSPALVGKISRTSP